MGTELINPNGPPMDPTKQYPEAMIYEAKKFTSIRVSEDTAARLRKYGVMGDSYNSLILKILARLNYLEGKERVK